MDWWNHTVDLDPQSSDFGKVSTTSEGDHFNTLQAELSKCIRSANDTVHEVFADLLSVATMSFLRDLYGDMPVTTTTTTR